MIGTIPKKNNCRLVLPPIFQILSTLIYFIRSTIISDVIETGAGRRQKKFYRRSHRAKREA